LSGVTKIFGGLQKGINCFSLLPMIALPSVIFNQNINLEKKIICPFTCGHEWMAVP
jgi:hypothetical protein